MKRSKKNNNKSIEFGKILKKCNIFHRRLGRYALFKAQTWLSRNSSLYFRVSQLSRFTTELYATYTHTRPPVVEQNGEMKR